MSFKNDELTLAAILENKEGSGGEKILVFPQGNGSLNVFFNLKATLIVLVYTAYIHTYILVVGGWHSVALLLWSYYENKHSK